MQKQHAIEMVDITMKFGSFKANDHLNLTVEQGEIHALIGENGAGKSTLMSILFGLYQQTSGIIKINGRIETINSPLVANELGIGMVHQHFKLVANFTVLENIILNQETSKFGFTTYKTARLKVQEIMDQYHFTVDLNKKIADCTVAEQQRTEIIKMLYRDTNILIFDEPTAVLTPRQITDLLTTIAALRQQGKTIIIITHKLNEIKALADRATIIRKGQYIGTVNVAKTTVAKMAEMMVGTQVNVAKNDHKVKLGNVVLEIANVTVEDEFRHGVVKLKNFSLTVKAGEIVAIAGVEGNGQTELINIITGLQKPKHGTMKLMTHRTKLVEQEKAYFNLYKGQRKAADQYRLVDFDFRYNHHNIVRYQKKHHNKLPVVKSVLTTTNLLTSNIRHRYQNGIAHIPEDRHKYGLVLDLPLWENTILQDYSNFPFAQFGFLKSREVKKYSQEIMTNFDVRANHGINSLARTLSGGNQQKFIVGRELSKDAELLIIAQPTRGMDIGAINNIHTYILKAKQARKAILLVSYELDEVMALADRIVVVNSNQKVGEVDAVGVSKQMLGEMMAGKMTKSKMQGAQ